MYAKTLVMANSKFVGRVVSYQMDLNPSISELYKKIIKFSNIPVPDELLNNFVYTLNAPKSLNTTNLSDMMNSADMVIGNIIKAATGENADQTDDNNKLKDLLYLKLMKDFIPSINWSNVDTYIKDSKLEIEKLKMEKTKEEEQ